MTRPTGIGNQGATEPNHGPANQPALAKSLTTARGWETDFCSTRCPRRAKRRMKRQTSSAKASSTHLSPLRVSKSASAGLHIMQHRPIRVLLVSGLAVLQQVGQFLATQSTSFELVGVADDVAEADAVLATLQPDVMVLYTDDTGDALRKSIAKLRGPQGDRRILVLARRSDYYSATLAFEAGALGYGDSFALHLGDVDCALRATRTSRTRTARCRSEASHLPCMSSLRRGEQRVKPPKEPSHATGYPSSCRRRSRATMPCMKYWKR